MEKANKRFIFGLKNFFCTAVVSIAVVFALVPVSTAGVTVYKDGDKYVELGGRIQLQYHMEDPDTGSSSDKRTDELFFRRLRPYIQGSIHKDWVGKFQWEMGKAGDENEISVEDAYIEYKGFEYVNVKLGNYAFPFSRENLTSSKKRQLVEVTFAGDHNYGTPSNDLGLHLNGYFTKDKLITWGLSAASACIDPSNSKLDFDTPVNKDSDFNQGWIVGGRVDFHPFGYQGFEQGDFKRELKSTIGVAAFTWSNDDDNNVSAGKDVDSVKGFEVSGALRFWGLSIDAEYNLFQSDLVDNTKTSGIYKNGATDLKNWSVCGGFMIIPGTLELVAAYENQDADNYDEKWKRVDLGVNWFLKKHDIKLQLTYRINDSKDGIRDNDLNELFVQAQYVF